MRKNLFVKINDEIYPAKQAAKILGRDLSSLHKRWKRGVNVDDLFVEKQGITLPKFGNKCFTREEWFKKLNQERKSKGWRELSLSHLSNINLKLSKILNDKVLAMEEILLFFMHNEKEKFLTKKYKEKI